VTASPPPIGLGLWKVPRDLAADLVRQAISIGYRHLDCACDYANEREVGEGIRAALSSRLCRREELWVTSKLWNTYHSRKDVRPAVERTLRDLGLDYLDLYLIHFPIAQEFVPFETRYPPGWFFEPAAPKPAMRFARVPLAETWEAMEKLVEEGLVRHIGVCNYGTALLRDLLSYARIRPAVLQIELHPFLTQEQLVRFALESGLAVTAFSPLGAQSYHSIGMAEKNESVLDHPTIRDIAWLHGHTPAQVVLRWALQRGTSIVPKTTRFERLHENLALHEFGLSAEEMGAVSALDRNRRFNDPGVFGERAFNTFCPIYE
jgi:diketogulonate reductase-like aldo/keto reductase